VQLLFGETDAAMEQAEFVLKDSGMEPISNLRIYYVLQRYSPEFEDEVMALYDKETAKIGIPIDDLMISQDYVLTH